MISITPVHLVVTSCTNLCTFDPAEVIISAFYVDTCCVNFDMDININMLMPKSEGVGGEKFDQNFATFY